MNTEGLRKLIPNEIKGLIFDLDGTLANTMPTHFEAWALAGKDFGVEVTSQMVEDHAGASTTEVWRKLNEKYGWSVNVDEGREMKSKYYRELLDSMISIEPIWPVYNLMIYMNGKMPMAVGTGSGRINADRVMSSIGADAFVKHLVSSDDISNAKPHPETFLKCCQLLGLPPHECLVFEDGVMGVEAALMAGCHVIEVPSYKYIQALP